MKERIGALQDVAATLHASMTDPASKAEAAEITDDLRQACIQTDVASDAIRLDRVARIVDGIGHRLAALSLWR